MLIASTQSGQYCLAHRSMILCKLTLLRCIRSHNVSSLHSCVLASPKAPLHVTRERCTHKKRLCLHTPHLANQAHQKPYLSLFDKNRYSRHLSIMCLLVCVYMQVWAHLHMTRAHAYLSLPLLRSEPDTSCQTTAQLSVISEYFRLPVWHQAVYATLATGTPIMFL